MRPLHTTFRPPKTKIFQGLPDLCAGFGVKRNPYPLAYYARRQILRFAELQDFKNGVIGFAFYGLF
jgi:hypothetical protein